ncbi:MAG: TetR/AcrR family transcriptional regulator [Lachnospiraceae bacterium]|nr:TetR/AcrR family transcriptional regulator [Lachnospiraceae bacterium]
MAPRNKFSRDEMIERAVQVVRKQGIGALTAKSLANELGVSTQPVFTCFHTIEEVRREVVNAAKILYDDYVKEGVCSDIPFLGFGMHYIRFAKEEPELYRLLFLSTDQGEGNSAFEEMNASLELVTDSMQETYHIDAKTAERYSRDMWLVAHSLATLIVTGSCPYTDQEIGRILTGFSIGHCMAIKEIPGFVEDNYDKDTIFRELIKK